MSNHILDGLTDRGFGKFLAELRYNSLEQKAAGKWDLSESWSRLENDIDYLGPDELVPPRFTPMNADVLYQDPLELERRLETLINNTKTIASLPSLVPMPYAWEPSAESMINLPNKWEWPRVMQAGCMPSIMNRAKWEYERFSSTWLNEEKGAFIANIPSLHRNSSWEEHFLRRALQGGSHPILTLHYLRIVFGVDFLTTIKDEIAS